MELQRTRLFLIISLFVVGFALYSEWQREHAIVPSLSKENGLHEEANKNDDIPSISENTANNASINAVSSTSVTAENELVDVSTDVLKVKIDPYGGDIVRAELVKYPASIQTPNHGEILLDKGKGHDFIAQTGLIGKDELGPDSKQQGRAKYHVTQKAYRLEGQSELQVDLHWENPKGLKVTKSYLFKPGSYLVEVFYQITNMTAEPWQGSMYGQLQREYVKKSGGWLGVQTYQGGAIYTPDKPYKKLSFPDMKKHPFRQQIEGGWVALVDHYFLCAFIPGKENLNHYYTRVDNEDIYNVGATTTMNVSPQSRHTVGGQIYIGPEKADILKQISPGLDLTIDYGILWPISLALFWLLKNIYAFVGNWGWSIVFVTLIIKILFYKLSASSYRSMGKMRQLQPRIEMLKQRYGEDKQQFSVALMELYRKEKMNPLGGCLPILIQIPVFIALYYVLLESIELRHAPFVLWIKDLSSRDPYYVLPLIMGATMFLQQKMNPPPPDPMQAKVMMLMPVIFTVLFLSFPSGLVLYWTVNNLLSILQQWYITRTLEPEVITKRNK